jgi:AcrR family transcriptional regulator
MARNSDDTRKRLLKAAAAEFAAYGIAGARVDRIAAGAQCNKQAIYAYYGSKEALCDAVLDAMVVDIVESVPIDAFDLPGYAVRLFDRYQAQPNALRLATWYALEGKPMPASAMASMVHKIEGVRQAQAAGAVSKRFSPETLLMLILTLTRMGAPGSPEAESGMIPSENFRRAIADAVARLVSP